MIFELVVEPSAARDIADADAHYAQFEKADAFLSAIDDLFEQLTSRPLMYPAIHGDVRRALLRRFPFSVFFIVEGHAVVVLAVHHQRRDPASRPKRPK
ncbi:MAG: type II toxin-antitoxin system RelE/ParE family toxin [Myxococcales bacterium]|nr:type II toxin-antitoxin system RelE/ParE family toxin [Myxococcales bacterium]